MAAHSRKPLPVLMPRVEGQRWSCHSCGECCRSLVGHLTDAERRRIDRQGWRDTLGVKPYVQTRDGWALNKHADGACVFLDEQNHCMIHSRFGESTKPLACRIFPFSVRPVDDGWQASFRLDCPSATAAKGEPLTRHQAFLHELVAQLPHRASEVTTPNLQRGLPAAEDELDTLSRRLMLWLMGNGRSMKQRLIGAARATTMLHSATLKNVRGDRFSELIDLLFDALPADSAGPVQPPTGRQRALLRQLAFVHAEHVTLPEVTAGFIPRWRLRWRQLDRAKRFRVGKGPMPPIIAFEGRTTFETAEAVRPADTDATAVLDLLRRYVLLRIESQSVYGDGFYGWPVFSGLAALWASVAAAGFLARVKAALAGRCAISFDDFARALGVVDRAATRLPAVGTVAERARIAYLARDDGLARLIAHGFPATVSNVQQP